MKEEGTIFVIRSCLLNENVVASVIQRLELFLELEVATMRYVGIIQLRFSITPSYLIGLW